MAFATAHRAAQPTWLDETSCCRFVGAAGGLRAVVVDPPDRGIEGDYWLCEIQGPASQATSRQAHATDLFEEGWWIVRIKWYRHITGTSQREYELLQNSSRWLSVSAIIRLEA